MRRIRIVNGVYVIFTSLYMASCATPPKEIQQPLAPPQVMRSGAHVTATAQDTRIEKWWQRFHDPVLNDLVEQALACNNQMQGAKANILQAQAKLKEAYFAWIPTLGLGANGFVGGGWDTSTTLQGPLAHTVTGAKLGNIHFQGYFAGFVPTYSLNILANIQNDRLQQASLDMQRASYASTRLSIINQVVGSYIMLLGQRAELETEKQYLRDLRKMRDLEAIRFHDGASDRSTLDSLDQNIANYEANMTSLRNSIAQLENAIQVLINRNPGPISTSHAFWHIRIDTLIPKTVPSSALQCRPDILMAQANLDMAKANVGIAYSNFFPKISLKLPVGGASFELRDLLKLHTGLWVAEALASMPILDGGHYQQIVEAKEGQYAAYFSYVNTLRSAFGDVDNSLTNAYQTQQAYKAQDRALRAADGAYHLGVLRYQTGAKDYRDVINAKLNRDTAKLNAIVAKMQALDGVVSVYQSLGAGSLV